MEHSEVRNIILLGKLGAGKSHSGNGILGLENHFKTKKGWRSGTLTCEYGSAKRNGRYYRVFDTPGINSISEIDKIDVGTEIKRCLFCTSPGFHAIILVMSADERITKEDLKMVETLNDVLGKKGFGYMILAVSKMDDDYSELNEMIECETAIKELDKNCQKRRVIFGDNNKETPERCLQRFDEEVDKLVLKNRKTSQEYFQHELYEKASEILEKDKKDYKKLHPDATPEEIEEQVRRNAALGYSPRDQELLDLLKKTGCCVIL